MYRYLTRHIKKRIIDALRYCFDSNPRHQDILGSIQEKYDFKERPQKGIILQSASASPLSLSADNFLGTKFSHVMLAHVDNHLGAFLDWVREDDRAVRDNRGVFPSDPGVYYIELESYQTSSGFTKYRFWVDPLLTVYEEPVIEFVTGNETAAILANAPVLEGSVDLYLYPNTLLFRGSGLELSAAQSLVLGGSDTHLSLGLETGQVPVSATTVSGPFTVISGTNDVLAFELNGTSVTATLPAGNLIAADVEDEIRSALQSAGVSYTDYTLTVASNSLTLEATETLRFESDSVSTANPLLGFTSGYVAPVLTGLMVQEFVPDYSTFRAVVDGVEVEIDLTPGKRSVEQIVQEIEDGFSSTTLSVDVVPAGDYDLDPSSGEITFLHGFEPGTRVIADYRYPVDSHGPYNIENGEVANNEAIPGVVLAFGNQLQDGDVMAVVIEENRDEVAAVYGGKFDVSLDIDVMARDSMTRQDLADLVVMYLWQWRREPLAEEGIILNSVSHGGESEEPYDEVGDDYYYLANISLSMYTDWEIHVEKPLFIRRVTPTSFDYDARMAASETGTLAEHADGLTATNSRELEDLRRIYVVDPTGEFELVR